MENDNQQKGKLDRFLEKLEKQGMPKHCGECEKYFVCTKEDPEKFCHWLKKYKSWQNNIDKDNKQPFH